MNRIIGFIRLQQIDTRIDQVTGRLNQLGVLLKDDQILKQISLQKKGLEQRIETSTKQLKLAEYAVQDLQIKIQQIESNLYGGKVKNPKELQDLQIEIDSIKRQLSYQENKLLDEMIVAEEDQKEYDSICIKFNFSEQELSSKNIVLINEEKSIHKELERLNAEKKAAENSSTSQDLSLYNKLRQQRGGIAVSVVSEGSCNSCGATLTPAQLQAVKSPDQMIYCPSCGRMLYSA